MLSLSCVAKSTLPERDTRDIQEIIEENKKRKASSEDNYFKIYTKFPNSEIGNKVYKNISTYFDLLFLRKPQTVRVEFSQKACSSDLETSLLYKDLQFIEKYTMKIVEYGKKFSEELSTLIKKYDKCEKSEPTPCFTLFAWFSNNDKNKEKEKNSLINFLLHSDTGKILSRGDFFPILPEISPEQYQSFKTKISSFTKFMSLEDDRLKVKFLKKANKLLRVSIGHWNEALKKFDNQLTNRYAKRCSSIYEQAILEIKSLNKDRIKENDDSSSDIIESEASEESLSNEEPYVTEVSINDLAPEILMNIFSFLSFEDLTSLSLVCKSWNSVSSDDYFCLKYDKKKDFFEIYHRRLSRFLNYNFRKRYQNQKNYRSINSYPENPEWQSRMDVIPNANKYSDSREDISDYSDEDLDASDISANETTIQDLSTETLMHIFSFLNIQDLARVAQVCLRWTSIFTNRYFRKHYRNQKNYRSIHSYPEWQSRLDVIRTANNYSDTESDSDSNNDNDAFGV